MAQLTDVLQPAQQADQVVNPANVGAGGLATALGGLSAMANSFGSLVARNAQQKRQAREDAMAATRFGNEQADRQATNQTLDTIANVNDLATNGIRTVQNISVPTESFFSQSDISGGTPQELTPEALSDINSASSTLSSAQIAVTQRRLSPLAINALYDQAYRQVRNDHPTANASLILKAFKDAGVDSGLFRELQQTEADQNSAANAVRDEQAKAYQLGRSVVDPTIASYAQMTEQDFVTAGRAQSAALAQAAADKARQDAQSSATRDAQGNLTYQQGQDARVVGQTVGLRIHQQMAPLMSAAMKALSSGTSPEVGSNADFETKAAQVIPALRARVGVYANNAAQEVLRANGTQEQANVARDAVIKEWEDTVFTPWEKRGSAFTAAATAVRDRLGVDSAILFPVLAQMRSLGLNVQDIDGFTKALPPNTIEMVKRDLGHLSQSNLSTPLGKLYLNDAIATLTGHGGGLAEMDANDPRRRQALTGFAYNNTVGQAAQVAAGKGDVSQWLNTVNQVILAAPSVNAAGGIHGITVAMSGIARNDVVNAMKRAISDPTTSSQATISAQSSRASVAYLVSEAKKVAFTDAHSDSLRRLKYDAGSGTFSWELRPGATMPTVYRAHGEGEYTPPIPAITAKQQETVRTLNEGIMYLSSTAGWDKNSPKGTPLEIRNYYAMDIPTKAMKTESAKPNGGRADPIAPLDALQNELLKTPDLIETPGPNTPAPADNHDIIGPEGTGQNLRSSAVGVGQFTNETWLKTLQTHAPQLIEGKSKVDILGMRSNQELARRAVQWLREDNAAHLSANGLPATGETTALAHFAGGAGAVALLRADPSTPVEQVLGARVITANPFLKGKTVAQTIDWSRRHFGYANPQPS